MVKVGKKIVKFRVPILILSIILLIPAVWGYVNTRINYDVLTYLPEDIETMQGQEIMTNDFGIGAFSMLMVDGMEDKEIVKLKEKVEKVDGVENVLWYDSLADISVPQSVLPSKLYDEYNTEDGTMMAVFFKDGTSSDETMKAITEIRRAVLFKWNVCDCRGHQRACRKGNTTLCTDRSRTFCTGSGNYDGIDFCSGIVPFEYRNRNRI